MDEAKGRRFLIGRERNRETICRTEEWWRLWFKSRTGEKSEILLTLNEEESYWKSYEFRPRVEKKVIIISWVSRIRSFLQRRSPFFAAFSLFQEGTFFIFPPSRANETMRGDISFSFLRLLCQLKKKKREGKKKKKTIPREFYDSTEKSLSAYFPLRTAKETNIRARRSWDSFLFHPFASPRVGSRRSLRETAGSKLEQGWFEFSVSQRAKIIGELSTCNNNYFVSFYRKPRNWQAVENCLYLPLSSLPLLVALLTLEAGS